MRKLILISALLSNIYGYTQNFQWARNMGGTGSSEDGRSVAVDANGNVYTSGYFSGTADFDPGAGTFNLIATGQQDIFISKLDASGNFVWARQIDGEYTGGLALDASGNIYTAGSFTGTVDFDPTAGTFNLTSGGSSDIFILKLDASGNFGWAKQMGGTSYEFAYSITVDGSGNVYTTGEFDGTADFDPGAGTYTLAALWAGDIFVSKLDASGNFVWAKKMGGPDQEFGTSIAVDSYGNVYTTGVFQDSPDFDPGPGTYSLSSAGLVDIFVSKLNAAGNFVWARRMGGSAIDYPNSIAVDASGNVYTGGMFDGTADFDPGAGTFNLTTAGYNDIFISKLDSSGNFLWARAMGGAGMTDRATSIALDGQNNVYSTGIFDGAVDFDPGAGTFMQTSTGYYDVFISKLDASGNFVWAKRIGPSNPSALASSSSIKCDGSGSIYVTGNFSDVTDFDPGLSVYNLSPAAGSLDIFVLKLSNVVGLQEETRHANGVKAYPNPSSGTFEIHIDEALENGELILINALGQIVHEQKIVEGTNEIKINQLPAGLYNYILKQGNQTLKAGKLKME